MASAVDETNLSRELQRYKQAGMGGVHIIPIYGAKGYEPMFIDYLSPKWMEMMHYTVREADRLGLGVDMTTGTGWCFGGPQVTDQEANANVVCRVFELSAGAKLSEKFDTNELQALVAFPNSGQPINLKDRVDLSGAVDWSPSLGTWKLYAISQKPSGQKVKRASPGGQGHMLNLIYPQALKHYLGWFDNAFSGNPGPKPRAMYHDSYEYRSEWAPDFLEAFQQLRGYPLQTELPALFSGMRSRKPVSFSPIDEDHIARVKSDYRETISDVMIDRTLPLWAKWARTNGFITRNEAHGSPGNWLDLYAVADIPETEMFHLDRNRLISKFASSAAHVAGRKLVAAETGTWIAEHFTETLADMKYLVDDLFLSGVNHVFYHGTCYSPDQAAWPGWLFYASCEMNPRNSIWRDAHALNAYVARCQSVLQAGKPNNDVLLYWPIHDVWHSTNGMARPFTVHARDWFEAQPIGKAAELLWSRGYAFDYVSDRQLASAEASSGEVILPGGKYRLIVVPSATRFPLPTLRKLLELARLGVTVVFDEHLPADVPGWGSLAARREELKDLLATIKLEEGESNVKRAWYGSGFILVGNLEATLARTAVVREKMFDHPGIMCVRRTVDQNQFYFVANRSTNPVCGWIPLAQKAGSVLVMDPLTSQTGAGRLKTSPAGDSEVFLNLDPGQSLILRCAGHASPALPSWNVWTNTGPVTELKGPWELTFFDGGPVLPEPVRLEQLGSWTFCEDTNAQRFAGAARYRITFDAPAEADHWALDLGGVCQSARIRLNGADLGCFFTPPFRTVVSLRPKGNLLELEVTNVSANRIRDLDRRKVSWKTFYDINFVGIDYKPFDASNWPLMDSGLLGPVRLTPVH